jgi:hypothetical protein
MFSNSKTASVAALALLAAAAACSGTSTSNTYGISGNVAGASEVTVTLSGAASQYTITDPAGSYSFSGLENGDYTITPSKEGFTFSPPNAAVTIDGADITGTTFEASPVLNPTYTISGSAGVSGVTLTLSGDATGTTTSGEDGAYQFTGLSNGSYQITPSLIDYTFDPQYLEVTVSSADAPNQSFTATLVTNSISGSAGIPGVTLTLSGAASATTTSGDAGAYQFTGLRSGTYQITPSLTDYTFDPLSLAVTLNGADVTNQDFIANPVVVPTYSISGSTAVAGATLTLSGAASATAVSSGKSATYQFSGLQNGNYRLTPSLTGYTFDPSFLDVTVNGANLMGQNFIANRIPTYSITGNIAGVPTTGLAASVTLSGDASQTVSTAQNGDYIFSGLNNGSYRVTPSLTGCIFTPPYLDVTVNGASVSDQNFTAASTGFSISGSTGGVMGVTLTLSGAASATTVSSGKSATYQFPGLQDGSYRITPSLAGYTFDPSFLDVIVNGANVAGQNFTANRIPTYSISGNIAGVPTGVAASVALSGDASQTRWTEQNGDYTFSGLNNGSYRVTPSLTGYIFTPSYLDVTVNGASVSAQNFTAVSTGFSISGTVLDKVGAALSGVTMNLTLASDGSTVQTVTTDVTGIYTLIAVGNGDYVVTPTLAPYSFSPSSTRVTVSGANTQDIDFAALP